MQPTALKVTALASSAFALVQAQGGSNYFPGQVIQPPSVDPNTLLQTRENGETVMVWTHYGPDGAFVGQVETCPAAIDFMQLFSPGESNQEILLEIPECAGTQNVSLSSEFCTFHNSAGNCEPIFFKHSYVALERAALNGTINALHVNPVRKEGMEFRFREPNEMPSDMPRHPFYEGQPMMEFSVSTVIPAWQEEVALEVNFDQPAKAFFVVKEDPLMDQMPNDQEPWGNWTDPYVLCKEDCSCTKRYIHDKYAQVKQRRRLTRKLQTCAQLGEDPDQPDNGECCTGLVYCHADWYNNGVFYNRCAGSQDLCNRMMWKEESDETPDPLGPDYVPYGYHEGTHFPSEPMQNETDHEYNPMCDYSACNQSEGCPETVDLFMNFYSDSSRMPAVIEFLQWVNLSAFSPLFEFFKCHIDFANEIWIHSLRESGQQVDDAHCKAEIDACFYEESGICRKIFLVSGSFSGYDRNVLLEAAWNSTAEEERAHIQGLFDNVLQCLPIFMEDPHHGGTDGNYTEYPTGDSGRSGVLIVPVDSLPCACGDGFSSVQTREVLEIDQSRRVSTLIDMCFASDSHVGNLQVQVYGKPGFDGTKHWQSTKLSDNSNQIQSILDCLNAGTSCSPQGQLMTSQLEHLLLNRRIRPAANRCGYAAMKYSGYSDIGDFEMCGEFNVSLNLYDMYPAIQANNELPSLDISIRERQESDENVLYRLHFESSSIHFQNSKLQMHSHFGAKSNTVVHFPPVVDSTIDMNNCHEFCMCDKVYILDQWNMHHNMPGSLEIKDEDIPCPCVPMMENKRNRVSSTVIENRDPWGGVMKFFAHEFHYCTTGERILRADYERSPYDLPTRWNWLCNCDLSYMAYESCLSDCQQVRGPWAWTCGGKESEGFTELDPFSQDTKDLRSGMCYN